MPWPHAEAMREVIIRLAGPHDGETICHIYNEGIEDRVATLETELRTPEERRAWLANRSCRHPVLVAEVQGKVVGWASLNVFNPRAAYRFVADLSVYVARSARGTGVGSRLLDSLVTLAGELGYHKVVLAAFPTNAAGMALYTKHGFHAVGIYREQGQLDGRWVDVIAMERLL
jgi:L-amino acid N-acyltransferase YncA